MPFILQKSNGKIIHVQRFFLVQIEIHRMSSRIMRPFQYPVSGRAWQTVLFPDIEKPDIRTNMQLGLYKRTSHDVFFSKTSLLQVEKHTGCKVSGQILNLVSGDTEHPVSVLQISCRPDSHNSVFCASLKCCKISV